MTVDRDAPSRRTAVLALGGIAAVLLAAVAGVGLLAGPAVAGDAVALFEFRDSEYAASAGDTVEVEVWVRSDGGYAGEGLESYEFVFAVPPAVGEPVDAEPGPFLAQGDGEVEQTLSDAGPGALRIRHERVGADNGTTGWARAATVTVEVREGAPAADAAAYISDPESALMESAWPMRSFGDNATLVVDGGGEHLVPAYDPAEDGEGGVNVTTARGANRTVQTDGGGDSGSAGGDPVPGFWVVAGLVGLVLGAGIARRR